MLCRYKKQKKMQQKRKSLMVMVVLRNIVRFESRWRRISMTLISELVTFVNV